MKGGVQVTKKQLVDAIKLNCFQCSGEERKELYECTVEHCPLWPYRLGITEAKLKLASQPTREKAPCT